MTLDGSGKTGSGQSSCEQKNGTYKCLGDIPYPSFWNDDERVDMLFAQFREREVNPENYDSKMKIWQDLIELYCVHTGTAIISRGALQLAFSLGTKLPYSLGTVIDDLYRSKCIRLYAEYEYDPLNSWKNWAMNGLIWRPMSWGFNKFKSLIGQYQEANTQYVHLTVLKRFCEKLQTDVLRPEAGKLMHFATFKQVTDAAHVHLKEKTLYLALITLYCQKKLALDFKLENNERHIHLIKIPALNEPNTTLEITQNDHATHQLQMTQAQLQEQLESLETEISVLDGKVRQLVNDNKRALAKNYLRKKRLLENNYAKRSLALHNIEELMNGVNEAQSNGQILDAYRLGSNALNQVLKSSGLTYDKVDEVVADVRESLDMHADIENYLASAGSTQQPGEESVDRELELELRDIINEERLRHAPDVPLHTPGQDVSRPTFTEDSELLAILNKLELEDSTPPRSNSSKNNSHIYS